MGIQGRLGTQLSVGLMPYMIFICLSAILNATLNVLGDFWVGAFSPLLLNLTMIVSLGMGYVCGWSMGKQTWILALSVLLGGILQCGWSAEALRRKQWVPTFMYAEGQNNADLRRVLTLFLPALLGAAVQQINLFVGRFLAFGLNQEAAAILYLANRFMEVPLGIFAAPISTVILPRLSLSVAQKNGEETRKTYDEGMTLMITLLLPAAGGLYFLGEPLLRLFFTWGRFAERDLWATVPALQIFALALPFYGVSSLLVRTFYAQQNTRTPVRVAVSILLVHGVLAITWMGRFQTVGLAWASTLSAMLQTFWLCKILRGQKDFIFRRWPLRLLRWLAATGGMVMGTKISIILLLSTPLPRLLLLFRIAVIVAISMGLYGGGIWFLDRRTARLWRQIFFYRQG
jgi:putative peptidoglycan lipid II flippase